MSIIRVTESDSFIIIFFSFQDKTIAIQSQIDKTFYEVALKFCNQIGGNLTEYKFYYNSIEIRISNKSLYEIGLNNRSTINVINAKYIIGGNDGYI